MCSGRDPVSSMFRKRPSIQEESTLKRETGRNSTIKRETGRDSTTGRNSTIGKESVRYTEEKPHDIRIDSITSESTKYIEEILNSKRRKARLVSRYVIITFILTNLMLVGFSILGSILVMQQINPCICPDNTPRTMHHSQAYAQRPAGSSESPTLTQSQTETQTRNQDQTSQDAETSQDRTRQEIRNKDYSIYIRVENTTNDSPDSHNFWNDV